MGAIFSISHIFSFFQPHGTARAGLGGLLTKAVVFLLKRNSLSFYIFTGLSARDQKRGLSFLFLIFFHFFNLSALPVQG